MISNAANYNQITGLPTIATLGPAGSDAHMAALQYLPEAQFFFCNRIAEIVAAFKECKAEYAVIPVYNTREGEVKEYFRIVPQMDSCHWVDNVVLPIQLSIGTLYKKEHCRDHISTIVGRSSVFRQCEEYIDLNFPDATQMAVNDIEAALAMMKSEGKTCHAVIESESLLKRHGLFLHDRELVPHNRTRFAVLSREPSPASGYDATAIITAPLKDRVGILADIMGEFTRRGINIIDLQAENDIRTQKLRIYVEVEGHNQDALMQQALATIESGVIQEENSFKVLGSFPRVDMRVKNIKSFGFIGTGEMSVWFARKLEGEGYRTVLSGRSTKLTPIEMIEDVDVVVVCVPISVTSRTIEQYGPYLRDGQALIILAGESEYTLATATRVTDPGVEIMFVHNLWGPQALTMKDKNASVVRTSRSGSLCSEFEAFLYKHGAEIIHDSAEKHDLLMGVAQKLPTTISVALAMTLKEHRIDSKDISSHSTLTSLYGILSMARVHNQHHRTYAEIMATEGAGRKIVRSFAENILKIMDLAEEQNIEELLKVMERNRHSMPDSFLESQMKQAKAVDDILLRPSMWSV